MRGYARFSLWTRLGLVALIVCALAPVATLRNALAQSPGALQQAANKRPANDLVVIKAGSIDGRNVDAEDCQNGPPRRPTPSQDQRVVTQTFEVKEGFPIGEGTIKEGVRLCGDGVAIDRQVVVLSHSPVIESLPTTFSNLKLVRPLMPENPVLGNLRVHLYTITDGAPVVDVVKRINASFTNVLTATPNYEIAAKPSPSIGGSPTGPPGLPMTSFQFRNQWSFPAIHLPGGVRRPSGRNVDLGIFDTYCGRTNVRLFRAPVVNLLAVFALTATEGVDVCGHGAYVASLTNALAPNAATYLYRVLDDYGVGDLATLLTAIDQFTKTSVRKRLPGRDQSQPLAGAIINLSLGINSAQGDEAVPLRDVLRLAYDAGATIVAAAGNDATPGGPIPPMQLPAAYTFVIGVGASNISNQRASYSNWIDPGQGDVAAPGGEGNCLGIVGAQGCVVGFLPTCKADFAAWEGTSFATPLVSGLAALVVEKGAYRLNPSQVRAAILDGTTAATSGISIASGLGNGIIDVERTLSSVP